MYIRNKKNTGTNKVEKNYKETVCKICLLQRKRSFHFYFRLTDKKKET